METTMSDEPKRPYSRAKLWILVALFFAPLAVAFLLYYGFGGPDGWRPSGSTNHGDLINPPRPLPPTSLPTPEGATLDTSSLHGKWTLVYIGSGECDARCREALTLMRQTRLALGDDISRVQRLFLITAKCCDQQYLSTEHAGLMLARLDGEPGAALMNTFPQYGGIPVEQASRIYVIDPLGNLMMSYVPKALNKGLLEDLKKLLKLSHIG